MNSPTTTPDSGLRQRNHGSNYGVPSMPAGFAGSPTLTSSSENSPQQATPHRFNESIARSSFRSAPVNLATSRKLVVRSDPALVSCFDPVTEKELYELWAPKK